MREEVILRVYGDPAPGGSKNAYPIYDKNKNLVMKNGRPVIVVTDAGGKANKVWKQVVNATACEQFREPPWDCPIYVEFHFILKRPKSHYGTGRNAAILKPGAPLLHTHAPDLTKLIRSTEDALTGRLWADDGLICQQGACSKMYGVKPGVRVVMREVEQVAVTADVAEPEPQKPAPFVGVAHLFPALKKAVGKDDGHLPEPGDGRVLYVAERKGVDYVFQRGTRGDFLLHKADEHDLATLPRG